jgi:hypothetical protein
MAMEKGSKAAPRWPQRTAVNRTTTVTVTQVQHVALVALLVDIVYRVAIRAHVRRAIGI